MSPFSPPVSLIGLGSLRGLMIGLDGSLVPITSRDPGEFDPGYCRDQVWHAVVLV